MTIRLDGTIRVLLAIYTFEACPHRNVSELLRQSPPADDHLIHVYEGANGHMCPKQAFVKPAIPMRWSQTKSWLESGKAFLGEGALLR